MQLVLDTNGISVKKRNKSFWIIGQKYKRIISPHRVSSIAVTADCFLSASAIRLAAQHKIPIYFFNALGKAEAKLWSPQFGSIATIRRQQVLFAMTPAATQWLIALFELKLKDRSAAWKDWQNKRHWIEKSFLKPRYYLPKGP